MRYIFPEISSIPLLDCHIYIYVYSPFTCNISQSSNTYWQTQKFTAHWDPIVFMNTSTYNSREPFTIRMKAGSMDSIKFQIDEWDYQDGIHPQEHGDIVVFELGPQNIAGMRVKTSKAYVDHNWQTVQLGDYFDTPP